MGDLTFLICVAVLIGSTTTARVIYDKLPKNSKLMSAIQAMSLSAISTALTALSFWYLELGLIGI